jgi:hypothetical protein
VDILVKPKSQTPEAQATVPTERERFLSALDKAIASPSQSAPTNLTLRRILAQQKSKSVLTRAELAEIEKLESEHAALTDRLASCSHSAARAEFKGQSHVSPLAEATAFRSRESFDAQAAIRRKSIKQRRRAIREAAHKIATAGWERIGTICETFAQQAEADERTHAVEWGTDFVPSPVLLCALSVSANWRSFAEQTAATSPRHQVAGLCDLGN